MLDLLRDGLKSASELIRKGFTDVPIVWRVWSGLVLLNYRDSVSYELKADEWSPLLRVCRGLVLTERGEVVSFPFHKFFNLNEGSETAEGNVVRWALRSVTEKVDGVMLQVFKHGGQLIWASRHGFWTEAVDIALRLNPNLEPLIRQIPFERWTLILELIAPEKRSAGMVNYGDLRALVPLAVRNLETLELTYAHELFTDLPEPFIPPQSYAVNSLWEAKQIVMSARTPEWEGLVLQGSAGLGNQLVKLKSPLYLHRLAIIKSLSPKRILENYKVGGLEQVFNLLAGAPEEVRTLAQPLIDAITATETTLINTLAELSALPIDQIPVHLRWVKTYPEGSEKWWRALRRTVVNELAKKGDAL